jgi:hypothetical protein
VKMSLLEFQRALCDMTLDPVFAASVLRRGISSLAGYELSAMEQGRLVAVVRQPGMSVNCTLARANRFAPIADAFPLTCSLLKPQLRRLLNELWGFHRPGNYQLEGEADAFARFLQEKMSRGELDHAYAEEVFRYERAAWELIQTLRRSMLEPERDSKAEKSATVRFSHDPRILVPCLERDEAPPADLPAGDYLVRLTLRGDTLEVDMEE